MPEAKHSYRPAFVSQCVLCVRECVCVCVCVRGIAILSRKACRGRRAACLERGGACITTTMRDAQSVYVCVCVCVCVKTILKREASSGRLRCQLRRQAQPRWPETLSLVPAQVARGGLA